ncbi:hypothetical protein GF358_03270 [Candidatus Woesearchaeota archaeon]|nr:hypothetical protein [Candidatus Woesearchaeota archaeon]
MPAQQTIIKVLKILEAHQERNSMLENAKKRSNFQILIATILSARARDEITVPISNKLFKKYPTPAKLANARKSSVEKIIKPIGFYKNKAKNIIKTAESIHEKYNDKIPRTKTALLELPGVGSKVANCVLVYALKKPAIPVDTHVHKVANRLGWVKTRTPEQTEKRLEEIVPRRYWLIVNEVFVVHGQDVCKSVPLCSECVIFKYCKRVGVVKSR